MYVCANVIALLVSLNLIKKMTFLLKKFLKKKNFKVRILFIFNALNQNLEIKIDKKKFL